MHPDLRAARLTIAAFFVGVAGCTSSAPNAPASTPSPSASASPAALATAEATMTPAARSLLPAHGATPTPTDAFAGWTLLEHGVSPGTAWSPDGQHILTMWPGATHLHAADGALVRSYPKLHDAVWFDASHFVAYAEYDSVPHVGQIVSVDGGDPQPFELPWGFGSALGSGQGAVAVARPRDRQWPDQRWDYRVWTRDGTSERRDGYPVGWSSDGTKLAVLHPFGRVRSPGGWLEVVTWPELRTIFADEPPYATGDAQFDPTSRFVAYPTSRGDGDELEVFQRVVSLESGDVLDLPRDPYSSAFWTADSNLAIVHADLSATTYDGTGGVVSTWNAPALSLDASVDGSTVAFLQAGSDARVYVMGNRETRDMPMPEGEDGKLLVSPDGRSLVALIFDQGKESAYLMPRL